MADKDKNSIIIWHRDILILISVVFLYGCEPSRGVASTAPTGFPAAQFYGNRWNNEHVRLNSDPRPTGTISLNLAPAGSNGFVMPFCGRIISEFGVRGGRRHVGIDIKLERGDRVYAAFDGMVRMARNYGDYGNVVVIRHYNGLETLYSHLNSISVRVNQRVNAGDLIGRGGRTGNATTEHLHFETRFMGEPFNPRLIIDFERCELISRIVTLSENSFRL